MEINRIPQRPLSEPDKVKAFFEGWKLYRNVVEFNYMKHREMIRILNARINPETSRDLRILELGCGDAYAVSCAIENTTLGSYYGIDLSRMALNYANENMCDSVDNLTLIEGNMVDCINNLSESFDLIIAGYSLHHLHSVDKLAILKKIHHLLARNGTFILYDLAGRTTENRVDFLDRCVSYFDKNWSRMSPTQIDQIRDHVLNQDYPESLDEWGELSRKAGFTNKICRFRDREEMYFAFELQS